MLAAMITLVAYRGAPDRAALAPDPRLTATLSLTLS